MQEIAIQIQFCIYDCYHSLISSSFRVYTPMRSIYTLEVYKTCNEGGSTSKVESKPIKEASIVDREVIMSSVKVGGYKFDIPKFDILWKRHVKGALKASDLGKVLRPKPEKINEED
jgi:hypothetical protein